MFKKVAPYMGEYKKYTIRAVIMMCIGIVAKAMPYFFLYQIISPLTNGQSISFGYVMLRVLGVLLCEIIYSFAYVKGLIFSHISASFIFKIPIMLSILSSYTGYLELIPEVSIKSITVCKLSSPFINTIFFL